MAALLKGSVPSTMRMLSWRTCQNASPQKSGLTLASCFESTAGYCSDQSDKPGDLGRYESIEGRTIEFSPSRTRDHSGATITAHAEDAVHEGAVAEEASLSKEDAHFDSYDAHGSISLNSAMQSTVPEPYKTSQKAPTHLNMPGGHIGQGQKYLSGHLQNVHYSRNNNSRDMHTTSNHHTASSCRLYANETKPCPPKTVDLAASDANEQLTPREKLKRAVKDYGSTVLVFHISISLMSLGGFYLAVSSGLDFGPILSSLGLGSALEMNKLAAGATTFVIAYAVHKVFAPVRIAITLTSVPFVVRYLRKIGFLKTPKPKG